MSRYGLTPLNLPRRSSWRSLTATSRLVVLHCYATEIAGPAGIGFVSPVAAADECGIDAEEWSSAAAAADPLTKWDAEESVLWIPEFLRFRRVSPARLEAVQAALDDCPASPLLDAFRAMHAECWASPTIARDSGICGCQPPGRSSPQDLTDPKRDRAERDRAEEDRSSVGGRRSAVDAHMRARARGGKKPKRKKPTATSPEVREAAKQWADLLNAETGSAIRAEGGRLRELVAARLAEEYSVEDLLRVARRKIAEWKGDERMRKFLRAETLLGRSKFEAYMGEADRPAQQSLPADAPRCPSGRHPPHPLHSCGSWEAENRGRRW